ncbi:Sodium-driven chloride bicarbonate exchanger, partial [Trichinella papuae]
LINVCKVKTKLEAMFEDILLEPLYITQHVQIGDFPENPSQRVKARGKEKFQDCNDPSKPIFCEMLKLIDDNERYHWKEVARWIKYEERVENVGHRWSKPNVPLVTPVALFRLKNCLKRGAVLLDRTVSTFEELANMIVSEWEQQRAITSTETNVLFRTLLRSKEHLVKSTTTNLSCLLWRPMSPPNVDAYSDSTSQQKSVPSEEDDFERKYNEQLKKYLENAESLVILIAQLPLMHKTVSAFVRLTEPRVFANLSEMPCPTRFLFVLITSGHHDEHDLFMVGRCMGALMTDKNFRNIAAYAVDSTELTYGLDEFHRDSVIIPPGKWHLRNDMEPTEQTQENEQEKKHAPVVTSKVLIDLEGLQYTGKYGAMFKLTIYNCTIENFRLFGGLVEDIKRRWPCYISDFKDVFTSWRSFTQCLAASVFLFFANLTNLIAFGGMMGSLMDDSMAVTECIVSAVISGILMGLFAGQPLCIMSATGPLMIFEALERGWNFLPARFWLCFWAALILLILVATDASFLVAYITRFTEELFATLVAIVFIVESFEEILALSQHAPMTKNFRLLLKDPCICNITSNGTSVMYQNYTKNECEAADGIASGLQCNFQPDVFSFSLLLFFGSFLLAAFLNKLRSSRFFTLRFREFVADFSLLLTVFVMTAVNYWVSLPIPCLKIPTSFKPTLDRSWFVNPQDLTNWWIPLACIIPGILFVVLIVMDQHVTTVMMNRKENKLRKGFGYHLDLLICVVLTLISGILAIPLFLSATILSLTHMHLLKVESKITAPGEKPIFIGVREQRFSPVFAHILIGLCIFIAPVERLIPIPVLLGVFLYMGASCLVSIEFFQRLLLFFTPIKNQPDFSYLRLIPIRRIHLFTCVQILFFIILCVVNYVDVIEIFFPLTLILLVIGRRLLSYIFSEKELCILDDPLPSWKMLKKGSSPDLEPDEELMQIQLLRSFGLSSKETYLQ